MTSTPTPTGRSRAGQKGGKQTLKRYGPDFYREIGRKGGKARARSPKKP